MDPATVLHIRTLSCWIQACTFELAPYEELDLARCAAAHRMQGASSPWRRSHGPAAGLLLTCARIGWTVLDPLNFISRTGRHLKVRTHSLPCFAAEVTMDTREWSDVADAKRRDASTVTVWWTPLHKTLRQLQDRPLARACLATQAAGGAWCQSRLYARQLAPHDRCGQCGSTGTLSHRVFHCTGWAPLRASMLSTHTQRWLAEVVPMHEQELALCHFPLSA
eukprot:5927122-Amphidinium_carterae.1